MPAESNLAAQDFPIDAEGRRRRSQPPSREREREGRRQTPSSLN